MLRQVADTVEPFFTKVATRFHRWKSEGKERKERKEGKEGKEGVEKETSFMDQGLPELFPEDDWNLTWGVYREPSWLESIVLQQGKEGGKEGVEVLLRHFHQLPIRHLLSPLFGVSVLTNLIQDYLPCGLLIPLDIFQAVRKTTVLKLYQMLWSVSICSACTLAVNQQLDCLLDSRTKLELRRRWPDFAKILAVKVPALAAQEFVFGRAKQRWRCMGHWIRYFSQFFVVAVDARPHRQKQLSLWRPPPSSQGKRKRKGIEPMGLESFELETYVRAIELGIEIAAGVPGSTLSCSWNYPEWVSSFDLGYFVRQQLENGGLWMIKDLPQILGEVELRPLFHPNFINSLKESAEILSYAHRLAMSFVCNSHRLIESIPGFLSLLLLPLVQVFQDHGAEVAPLASSASTERIQSKTQGVTVTYRKRVYKIRVSLGLDERCGSTKTVCYEYSTFGKDLDYFLVLRLVAMRFFSCPFCRSKVLGRMIVQPSCASGPNLDALLRGDHATDLLLDLLIPNPHLQDHCPPLVTPHLRGVDGREGRDERDERDGGNGIVQLLLENLQEMKAVKQASYDADLRQLHIEAVTWSSTNVIHSPLWRDVNAFKVRVEKLVLDHFDLDPRDALWFARDHISVILTSQSLDRGRGSDRKNSWDRGRETQTETWCNKIV